VRYEGSSSRRFLSHRALTPCGLSRTSSSGAIFAAGFPALQAAAPARFHRRRCFPSVMQQSYRSGWASQEDVAPEVIRSYNALRVRFCTTLGREPEIELSSI